MTAARTGNPEVVNALIARGANVNAAETWQGQTALMWAALENNPAAVKALVDHGADMEARSKELSFPEYRYETNGMAVFQLPKGGWTALMYAARENAIDATAALADLKADLNAASRQEGTTALQLAIINVHYDLANLLLEKGADPNVTDSSGHDRAVRDRRHARAGQHADATRAEAPRQARCDRPCEGAARARRRSERAA